MRRLVITAGLIGCAVAPVDLAQKPCPCAQGFICLTSENACAPELTTAPFALETTGPIEVPRRRSRSVTIRRVGEARRAASLRLSLPAPLAATEATLQGGATDTSLTVVAPDMATGMLTGKLIATVEGIAEPYSRDVSLRIVEAPGDLDRTFGEGGVATIETLGPAGDVFSRRAVTFDLDGGLVIGHNAASGGQIVRITPEGKLDATFGSAGISTLSDFVVSDLVGVQGGVLVVGHQGNDAAIARLDSVGNRVSGFGNNGVLTTSPPSSFTRAYWLAVSLLSDGSLLTGGYVEGSSDTELARTRASRLAKLRLDGSPNPTFGRGGFIVGQPRRESATPPLDPSRFSISATSDEKRILAFAQRGWGNYRNLIVFTATGELDPTFQLDGTIPGQATQWRFVSGNRILGAGGGTLRRLLPEGALDESFGTGGIAPLPFESDEALSYDGQILAVGPSRNQFFTLIRFLDNGREDVDFGQTGRVTESFVGPAPTIRIAVRHRRIVVATISPTDASKPELASRVTLRRYFP